MVVSSLKEKGKKNVVFFTKINKIILLKYDVTEIALTKLYMCVYSVYVKCVTVKQRTL